MADFRANAVCLFINKKVVVGDNFFKIAFYVTDSVKTQV
jgi:hypothetical protein